MLLWTLALVLIAPPSDDTVWREFLDWYKAQKSAFGAGQVLSAYASALTAEKLDQAEIARRIAIIRKTTSERTEALAIHFDKIYTAETPLFTSKPNALLASVVEGLTPGLALDISMGQGRNAVFLARNGWRVTGFDISTEGLRIAREQAARAGVPLETVESDYRQFDFGRDMWDLVVMSYAFVDLEEPTAIQRIVDSLKHGGHLVFEHFLADSKAPGVPLNYLLTTFGKLQIVQYQEVLTMPDWGTSEARIGRLVAVKP